MVRDPCPGSARDPQRCRRAQLMPWSPRHDLSLAELRRRFDERTAHLSPHIGQWQRQCTGSPPRWASPSSRSAAPPKPPSMHWSICRASRCTRPAPNHSWPAVWRGLDVATITFVVSYGNDHNAMPESLRQAIMMLAAYWFNQREVPVKPALLDGTVSGRSDDGQGGRRSFLCRSRTAPVATRERRRKRVVPGGNMPKGIY